MAKKFRQDEGEEIEHGWADATGRHPLDALLRKHGFRVHSRTRVKGRLVTDWIREGEIYTEKQALKTLDRNDLADAEYEEVLRYGGLD